MNTLKDVLNITPCNIAQMIGETSRFVFHMLLISICTVLVEGRTDFLNRSLFKTLFITAMAVMSYHLFIRKLIEPPLKKLKTVCIRDGEHLKYKEYEDPTGEEELKKRIKKKKTPDHINDIL